MVYCFWSISLGAHKVYKSIRNHGKKYLKKITFWETSSLITYYILPQKTRMAEILWGAPKLRGLNIYMSELSS